MKNFLKNYGFMLLMILGIVAGCAVGALWPNAMVLKPLGTLYINMMFCIVVPMVFCSIASAVANMSSAKKAGKVMGVTIASFVVTATIAATVMYLVVRFIPLVSGDYTAVEGPVDEAMSLGDMIVAFFTKPDFSELLSRKASCPC
jgi:Na+/H+-dicarboxylate symporter